MLEALSCRDVERLFGVPAKETRTLLKKRVAQGDDVPAKIHIYGAWLAPLWWWREVLSSGR